MSLYTKFGLEVVTGMRLKSAVVGTALLMTVCAPVSVFAASNSTSGAPSGHGFSHGGGMFADLPKILGISQATLQKDLKAGKTLVQIAASKKISEATLIKKMEADYKTQLDTLVKSKKLTSAQEKSMISRYDANVKHMVEQKGMGGGPGGHWSGKPGSNNKKS